MSSCLIEVGKSGNYCCMEAPGTDDDILHLDLDKGALIIKAANLPVTPILCQVGKEWVDSGETIGGDVNCTVLCKPGRYKFDLSCSDYLGVFADLEAPTELCYECDPDFDKAAWALVNAADVSTTNIEILQSLCDKLEVLISISNDATALASILLAIQALCDKILTLTEQQSEVCDKLLAIGDQLTELCEKLEAGFECLEVIKADIKLVLIAVEAICTKLDTLQVTQDEILDKLCSLTDLIKLVPNACAQSAVIGWCGRPAQFAEYAYGDISESSLPDFNAAWVAAGGKTWIAGFDGTGGGECHMFCPAIPGATFTINGVAPGNGNVLFEPNPNAEALGCLPTPALTVCAPSTDELLAQILDKLCQILGDPDAPCPDCPEVKTQVVYTNTDNTTELDVSVGGNGDIKITSGNGDSSDDEVTACITACLAAGDDVVITWTTVDGGSGSATLLASAQTNAFPNFYNQSTDAVGDSGKLLTLTCG